MNDEAYQREMNAHLARVISESMADALRDLLRDHTVYFTKAHEATTASPRTRTEAALTIADVAVTIQIEAEGDAHAAQRIVQSLLDACWREATARVMEYRRGTAP
jgi:hypothetical protein